MTRFLWGVPLFFALSAAAATNQYLPSTNPAQVTIVFGSQEIKTMDPNTVKNSETTLQKMVENDREIYDSNLEKPVVVKSSNAGSVMRSAVDNGLLGTMFTAYSNHIPLTLRPDDVWLAIATSFAHYVDTHAEQMRSQLVTNKDKVELVVHMAGSLDGSNQAFWTEFTRQMLELTQKYTTSDLRGWLVPGFSTTTEKDRLVGQFVMMGAMKSYFGFGGVLSCAVTKLTLQGTLNDWIEVRDRAAKLSQFGGDLAVWADVLVPVLDEFVAAYKGQINDDFWQKMITYKRVGSGGNKYFRGWFMVFAPFNKAGKYLLQSKDQIEKTGIYAEVLDNAIFHATVEVPVWLDDNGVRHDLVFFGGLTGTQYNVAQNLMAPAVDWAIVDKQALPHEQVVTNIMQNAYYYGYDKLDAKYKKLISESEFNTKTAEIKAKQAQDEEKYRLQREAAEKAKLDGIVNAPADERVTKAVKEYYWSEYKTLPQAIQAVVTEAQFTEAKTKLQKEYEAQEKKRQEDDRKAMLALPKEELLNRVAGSAAYRTEADYEGLDPEYRKIFTRDEYEAAVAKLRKEYQKAHDWQ